MKEPKIRFKGFKEEWSCNKIGNISTSYSGGTPTAGHHEFYGGGIPFIRSGEIHNDTTELYLSEKGLNSSSAKMVEKGTILYALYGATSGEVDICKISGAINQAILAIIPNSNINHYYLASFLKGKKEQIINSLLQGGQGNLSGALIKNFAVNYPALSEQRLIASYFQSLDTLIQATSKQLASLKQIKAASLQSMFPQKGETKPMVRFKGFDGEWNTRSFADTFIFLKNNSLSRAELSEHGTIRNIHYGDILIKFGALINITQDDVPFISDEKKAQGLSANYQLQEGDIIFADAAEDLTVGKCSELISTNKEYVVAGLHTIPCRPQLKFAEGYLGYYLNSPAYHNQLLPLIQGTKISSISKKTMNCTNIFYPPKEQEQQKIASYFRNLDRQITLQARRLEKLKQIKAACLDKMFV